MKELGYSHPLFVLAFDHRSSFTKNMLGVSGEPDLEQTKVIIDFKNIIFEGFKKGVLLGVPKEAAAVLCDEQYGDAVLRKAKKEGFIFAMCTEKSGEKEYKFEYSGQFGEHIKEYEPNFAKALVRYNPEDDKELNQRQLEKLKHLGIDTVVMAAGHMSHVIEDTIGHERGGLKLVYAIEDKKLGTGGAIKYALTYVKNPDEPSIVLNGDVLSTVDFGDMVSYLKPESEGIILGSYVEDVASYGTLEYDAKYHLKKFKEKEGVHKPGYQNGGCYIFTKHAYQYFPAQDTFSIEYDVFPKMKDLYVYESDRPWIDVGLPERLAWAREHWQIFT